MEHTSSGDVPGDVSPDNRVYLTWDQCLKDIDKLCELLEAHQQREELRFDQIVAITRGGLIPAGIISKRFDIHYIDTICIKSYHGQQQQRVHLFKWDSNLTDNAQSTLIIDDISDTGATARQVQRQRLSKATCATLYVKPLGRPLVHIYVREYPQDTWIHFPWEHK